MIKISVEATVLHLMVDDKVTLALKLSDGTYVDFPIYDESFPLVKAGKKFRLTLEEVGMESDGSSKLPSPECLESQSYTIPDHVAEMYMNSVKGIEYNTFYPDEEFKVPEYLIHQQADGPIDTLPKFGKVGDMLRDTRNSSARIQEVDEAKKPYPNNEWLVENSKWDGKTPYHIIDELRRDVAALGTIKKALNQLEVRNEERLASYPDPEIEAHRKRIQEVIMQEAKKVEGMITGSAVEVDEAANKENEEATPMIYPCDMCIHVKVGYPKEGVCSGCKNFDKLDPSGAESAAEVREKYIKWDRYDKAPDELMPMSDEEVSEFTKTRLEYPEELAQECQGSLDEVSEGPFCDGCKHIGVNPESGPCAVCFEGMMYESNKGVTMENEVNPDESVDKDTVEDSNLIKVVDEPVLSDTQYNARKRKCGKCANSSNPSACISCSDYSKFEPSRYR